MEDAALTVRKSKAMDKLVSGKQTKPVKKPVPKQGEKPQKTPSKTAFPARKK